MYYTRLDAHLNIYTWYKYKLLWFITRHLHNFWWHIVFLRGQVNPTNISMKFCRFPINSYTYISKLQNVFLRLKLPHFKWVWCNYKWDWCNYKNNKYNNVSFLHRMFSSEEYFRYRVLCVTNAHSTGNKFTVCQAGRWRQCLVSWRRLAGVADMTSWKSFHGILLQRYISSQ